MKEPGPQAGFFCASPQPRSIPIVIGREALRYKFYSKTTLPPVCTLPARNDTFFNTSLNLMALGVGEGLFITFAAMIDIVLKKGKEKAVLHRHPWVFSGAIEAVKGKAANGDIVRLLNAKGDFMAYGFYNDQSRVALRLLEWDENVTVDETWFRTKVEVAVAGRSELLSTGDTNTCRLIFSESDYLPGLIVDKYAGHLAVQVLHRALKI